MPVKQQTRMRVALIACTAVATLSLTACADGFGTNRSSDDTVTVPSIDVPSVDPSVAAPSSSESSPSSGVRVVDEDEMEDKVLAAIRADVDEPIESIECAGDLEMAPGNTQECAIEVEGGWRLVTVTVEGEDGADGTAPVGFEIDDEVTADPPAFVE